MEEEAAERKANAKRAAAERKAAEIADRKATKVCVVPPYLLRAAEREAAEKAALEEQQALEAE